MQLIGVHYPNNSSHHVPTVVMEYLPMTLTQCLEKYSHLPAHMECSILLDVVSGLEYLHEQSPPIMHRDLTPNNVLLTSHMQAKISDLGQSKIVDISPVKKNTTVPGNVCYMPPEALVSSPEYSTKIDVFSFGVLVLHVVTHQWPFRKKSLDPKTNKVMSQTEVEMRKEHIDKMGMETPLKQLFIMCLDDNPAKRPNATMLVESIRKYSPVPPFVNTLEMELALEAESTKALVLETHLQEVDLRVRTIAGELDCSDSAMSAVHIDLKDISFANEAVLTGMESTKLIVGYKSSANKGNNDIHLSLMRGAAMNVVAGNTCMDILVRAPLHIHFTGTLIRIIEGIKAPRGLAAGSDGRIFVTDSGGYKGVLVYSRMGELCGGMVESLRRFSLDSSEGKCYYPHCIAMSGEDSFILADTWSHRIQKFKLSSDLTEAVFVKSIGSEGGGERQFSKPWAARVDKTNGDIYVCDRDNHRIQVLDQQLEFKRSFGTEGSGLSNFEYPRDVGVDSKGNIYVADSGHYVIKVFNQSWEYQGQIGGEGHGKGTFHFITSICIDKHDYLYATDKSWNCIQVFNPRREFVMQVQLPGTRAGSTSEPLGIAVDDEGFVYVSGSATGSVYVYK